MLSKLRNKKGLVVVPGLAIGVPAIAFICSAISLAVVSYALRTPHRARKAVSFCYCMAEGKTEFECKAEGTVIDVQPGDSLDYCETKVENMSKEEILSYIKDDVVLTSSDNLGVIY